MNSNYNLRHRIIACVLLLSLFLQSCRDSFNQITRPQKESIELESGLIKQAAIKQLVEQKLAAEGWELLDLCEDKDVLKAKSIEKHGNFTSNPYELSVSISPDVDLEQLSYLSWKEQQRMVHFNFPRHRQPGCIVIFGGGLSGGMKKGIDKTINKEEHEKGKKSKKKNKHEKEDQSKLLKQSKDSKDQLNELDKDSKTKKKSKKEDQETKKKKKKTGKHKRASEDTATVKLEKEAGSPHLISRFL